MKGLLLLLTVTIVTSAGAQCLSGNCKDGKGKFDFGWCTYEGTFKDSKPDGEGAMKYSDYTYTGHFSNGVEDGAGTITYADGRKEAVSYHNGRKTEGPVKVAASDYKPIEGRDPGCLSGDCNNGFGTFQYPSGNKYVGTFKHRTRDGQGTFYFTDGNQFTGTWQDNKQVSGTFTFPTGAQYTGTYDSNGKELNGVVTAGSRSVPIVNGKAVVPKQEYYGYENTAATRKAAEARGADKPKVPVIQWGGGADNTSKDKDDFDRMMRETDKRLEQMDRAWRKY